MFIEVFTLVKATMPPNNADQAASPFWFTDKSPREALSFGSAVNKSNSRRSAVGEDAAASNGMRSDVQYCHVFKPKVVWVLTSRDLR